MIIAFVMLGISSWGGFWAFSRAIKVLTLWPNSAEKFFVFVALVLFIVFCGKLGARALLMIRQRPL